MMPHIGSHIFTIIGPFSDIASSPYTVRGGHPRFVRDQKLQNSGTVRDIDGAAESSHQSYRIGLEWSRKLEGRRDIIAFSRRAARPESQLHFRPDAFEFAIWHEYKPRRN
jgi:hypothetical protein